MKMVTTFNKKDLVSFGNYLFQQIKSGNKQVSPDGEHAVSDADLRNWKEGVDRVRNGQVRAKMCCNSITDNIESANVSVVLSAVTAEGQGENSDYSKWTPMADLSMIIDNGTPARDFFEEGKDYYVDFTKFNK